jgi:hypothetical protein
MRAKFVNEGTTNYWPGYSDDGTADKLSEIKKKTSEIQNDELRRKEKEVISYKSDLDPPDKAMFFQKWMYANMILTSLQDGFYIDGSLLDRALELYTEIIRDPKLDEYLEGSKDFFRDSIELVLTKLSQKIKEQGEEVYAPGFLDKDDEDRIRIDKKFDNYYE